VILELCAAYATGAASALVVTRVLAPRLARRALESKDTVRRRKEASRILNEIIDDAQRKGVDHSAIHSYAKAEHDELFG
jgi:hypothetical protein